MQREPDRLPAADAPDNDSGREIHRLHPQVVQQVQPRAPGIFIKRLLRAPDGGRQQRIAGQRLLGGGHVTRRGTAEIPRLGLDVDRAGDIGQTDGHTPPAVRNPDVYPVPVDDRSPGGIVGNPHIRTQFPADDGPPREVFPAPALPHKTPGLGQFVGCHPPGYPGLVHRRLYEECLSHRLR